MASAGTHTSTRKRTTPPKAAKKAADKEVTRKASAVADKYKPVELPPPHTDPSCQIVKTRKVKGATVIKARGAQYRGTTFDGTLELAPDAQVQVWRDGSLRAAVVMDWYDWAPTRGYPRVMIPKGQYSIKENYTGEVVSQLGR